jgi:hypothetical protein
MGASLGKDYDGKPIEASATRVRLPSSATDADIALLAQHCKQLQELDLTYCDKITGTGLQTLSALKQLRQVEIQLHRCDKRWS